MSYLKATIQNLIDLRSDTVTKPSPEMLHAMTSSSLGDDYYQEDFDTRYLERISCQFFGAEDAVFLPTGTMANQIAIRCALNPGGQIICDKFSHIVYHCSRGTADLGKVFFNTMDASSGIFTKGDVEKALDATYMKYPSEKEALVWIENTIGHYGGRIFPFELMREIFKFTRERKIHLHLDGARLLNACSATGILPKEYVQLADTTMFSFSKGLGSPLGSILLGTKKALSNARMYQKWYGGGLHQSGILASACIFALQNNVPFLLDDHRHASLLASIVLSGQEHVDLQTQVDTNIVMFDFSRSPISAKSFVNQAKEKGILLFHWSRDCVRAVTHRDISKKEILFAGKILNGILLDDKVRVHCY